MRLGALFILGFLSVFLFVQPKEAQACCVCRTTIKPIVEAEWPVTREEVNTHASAEFQAQRILMISIFWEDNVLPAMMLMAEQLTAVAMHQIGIIGTFFDAKHQMETQSLFQKDQARIHKDYQPSMGMCELGTNVMSLAPADRKSEYNAVFLSQRAQDRGLGASYSAGASGESADKAGRLAQFRNTFCDPADVNNGLAYFCDHDQVPSSAPTGAADQNRMNRDIDFVRTVAFPWTLNIDFTDGQPPTNHEEEVLALASNLYGHNVFRRPPAVSLSYDQEYLSEMQESYVDARALLAKRSVAENSFNAITAMKGQGSPGSREFMSAVVQELGLDAAQAGLLLSDGSSDVGDPSYYAQMEVLTKKIYQNPDFYTNLYDTPANVKRKSTALRAIHLMQKFDLFKSYLRNEASLSVLLELAVMDLQEEVENEFGRMAGGGTPAQ